MFFFEEARAHGSTPDFDGSGISYSLTQDDAELNDESRAILNEGSILNLFIMYFKSGKFCKIFFEFILNSLIYFPFLLFLGT